MTTNYENFTAPNIKRLKSENGKNQSFYWDSKTPSLGVRVTANGAKSFIFQSWYINKSIRITIGNVDTWSISEAQSEARRLKVLTDQGIDPRVERAELDAQNLASQTKIAQGLVVWEEYIKDRTPHWGDRHLADNRLMIKQGGSIVTRGAKKGKPKITEDGILRKLLSLPLSEINRETILKWIKKERVKRPARVRLALALLKAFIAWLNNEPKYKGIIDKDTCDGLMRELPTKTAKDDCLQREQLELWFKGVRTINNPTIRSYLEILLLTGARRGELSRVKWSDLDTQWHTATIRDKVEGTRKIPLTPYVELLLSQIPRVSEYVFASPTSSSGYISEPSIAHKQAIQSVGLPNMTIQGLRRSFGTLAEWVECPVGISAQIMGHKPSALAEKHYRVRPMELLRKWHTQIEKFILDNAGIIQPTENEKTLRVVNTN